MANSSKKKSGLWGWIVAILVAAAALGVLFYIGWFDERTHVDTPAGDNVEQQYNIEGSQAQTPGVADWQNADGENLREAIVDPEVETQTPPGSEAAQ